MIKKKKHVCQVFRHGDNSPDNTADQLYPTDPFKDRPDLFPLGYGELREVCIIRFTIV